MKHPLLFYGRIVAFCLGVFVLAEATARLTHVVPPPLGDGYYALRAALGGYPEPYVINTMPGADGGDPIGVRFNVHGHRGSDHPLQKPEDNTRIMLLGDSYTFGWNVADRQTYPHHLQALLDQTATHPTHVINAGFIGWGTDRQYIYFREAGATYASDVVILQLYVGDLINNGIGTLQEQRLPGGVVVPQHRLDDERPYFIWEDEQLLEIPPRDLVATRAEQIGGVRSFLRYHSATYQVIENYLGVGTQPQPAVLKNPPPPANTTPEQLPMDYYAFSPEAQQADDWQDTWAITQALMRRLRDEVEASGGDFRVLFVDSRWLVDGVRGAELRERYQMPAAWDMTYWGDQYRAFMEAEAIPYLDVLPSLHAFHEATGEKIVFESDGHWTPAGNCVVAVAVHNWLVQEQLVAPSAPQLVNSITRCAAN